MTLLRRSWDPNRERRDPKRPKLRIKFSTHDKVNPNSDRSLRLAMDFDWTRGNWLNDCFPTFSWCRSASRSQRWDDNEIIDPSNCLKI
jgi:hypothetical protein